MSSNNIKRNLSKGILYFILLIMTAVMLLPFLWMLSSSVKLDREVFVMNPFVWIPEKPRWQNYVDIWTKVPFFKYVQNTVILTVVVTCLQILTSSFAAYAFAKLDFKHKNKLFLHISQQLLCLGRFTWFHSSL